MVYGERIVVYGAGIGSGCIEGVFEGIQRGCILRGWVEKVY